MILRILLPAGYQLGLQFSYETVDLVLIGGRRPARFQSRIVKELVPESEGIGMDRMQTQALRAGDGSLQIFSESAR